MAQRSWIGEIIIGVVATVIAAILIARFGLDKHGGGNGNSSPVTIANKDYIERQKPDPEPSFSLIGSWQGSFLVNNYPVNDIYTFHANGTWTEATFNQYGQPINNSYGRYNYANGQVNISFSSGGSEKGSVTWIDANQFHYQIIDHTDRAQVGLEILYRRVSQ